MRVLLLTDELRKYRSFKEAYFGWFVALLMYAFISIVTPSDFGYWYVFQQRINDMTLCVGIVVIFGVARLFCYEKETGCSSLVAASRYGVRSTFIWKVVCAFGVCFAAVVLFASLDLICGVLRADPEMLEVFEGRYGGFNDKMTEFYFYKGEAVSHMTAEGETVRFITGDVPQMTNAAYYVVQYLFMLISYFYFASFIMFVSVLTDRTSTTVTVSGGLFVTAMYYNLNMFSMNGRDGIDWLYRLSFGGYIFHDSFSWYSGHWSDTGKPVIFCICATAVLLILTWKLWKRRERV